MLNSFYDFCTIYGEIPNFTVKGQKLYTNTLGHCTSFSALVCMSLVFIFFFKELIIKTNPRIETIISNDLKPLSLNLGDDNFIFIVGLHFPNLTNYVSEKIYKLEVSYIHQRKNEDGTVINEKTPVEVTTCDKVYIPVLSSFLSSLALDQFYCIKNKTNLFLEGDFGLQQWSFIDFKFKQCTGENCDSDQTIDSLLKGGYITIYTSDFNIFPSNYKDSTQLYGKTIFSSISNQMYKEMWIYYRTIQFQTDDGWFGHTNKTYEVYSLRDYTENFDFREDNEKTFLHIYLRSSRTRYIYSRIYEKIDSTLTKIISITQLIYFIFRFISEIFNKDLFKSYICSFYDADFRKSYQHFRTTHNNLEHKISQKGFNEVSQHSGQNADNFNNTNPNIYSSISGILGTNNNHGNLNYLHRKTKLIQKILQNTNNNETNNNIFNNNLNNNANNSKEISQFIQKRESDNLIVKTSSYVNSIKKSYNEAYPPTKNQMNQFDQINSTSQNVSVNNIMKNKSSNTSECNKQNEKKSEELNEDRKKISAHQENEIEKAFKSIQNPNYKMKPFTFSKVLRYLVCQVDTFYEFKYIQKCYKNVGLYFDVIRYLKIFQEIEYMKNQVLKNNQIKMLQHNFLFEKNSDSLVKQYCKLVLCSTKL